MNSDVPRYGVVAIGRNEGERLAQSLRSVVRDPAAVVVYVDSGSTDGSVARAAALGAHVVELDMSKPFTAARARNQGFARLQAVCPEVEFVQFVDGDCEVDVGWIAAATAFLRERADVVAVTGTRRERFPERSIYNALCDLSWQSPVGENRSFGGDVLLRSAAVSQLQGYNPTLIAGEEPEFSIRLRAAGWKIWHLDVPMTLHDANILHFSQWWRRSVRTGWAYAEGAAMNGNPPERHWVRETSSALVWGLGLPLLAIVLLPVLPWASAFIAVLYPVQAMRLSRGSTLPPRLARLNAVFLIIGKFAESAGAIKYLVSRLRGQTGRLIEYK